MMFPLRALITIMILSQVGSPILAEVYWWPNNEHECEVVESVRADLFGYPQGVWLAGKADFTMKATTCHAYALGDHSEEPDDPRVLKNTAHCQPFEKSSHAHQVVQFYDGVVEFDLEITRETELYTRRISSQSSIASASFYTDGIISLLLFLEENDAGSGEIFMVTAKCTYSEL